MLPGGIFKAINGTDGTITIPGLGAVVGIFHKWTLTRSEENAPGNPVWTLRGVLSYRNATLLTNESLDKQFKLVLSRDKVIELCSFKELKLVDHNLIVEGVTQCQ